MEFKFGYNHTDHHGRGYFSPSQTVQDDALSIREILVRFAGGQALPPIQQEGSYPTVEPNIDDELADLDPNELTDLQRMIDISNERAKQMQDKAAALTQKLAALKTSTSIRDVSKDIKERNEVQQSET